MGWEWAQATQGLHRLLQPSGFAHRLQNLACWVRSPAGPGLGPWLPPSPNKVGVRTEGRKRPGQGDCKDSCPCARPPLHTWATAASCPKVGNQSSLYIWLAYFLILIVAEGPLAYWIRRQPPEPEIPGSSPGRSRASLGWEWAQATHALHRLLRPNGFAHRLQNLACWVRPPAGPGLGL